MGHKFEEQPEVEIESMYEFMMQHVGWQLFAINTHDSEKVASWQNELNLVLRRT